MADNDGGLQMAAMFDPSLMQAAQAKQLFANLDGPHMQAGGEQNASAIANGMANLFPSPQVQQARQAQQALRAAQLTQNDGESDLDFQLRQSVANQRALAPINPGAAMSMTDGIARLAEQRSQQQRLTAQDQRAQATFDAGAGARAEEAATGGYAYLAKTDRDGTLTDSHVFDTTDPKQAQALKDQLSKDPSLKLLSQKDIGALVRSDDSSSRKLAQQLLLQQQKEQAGLLPSGTEGQFYMDTLLNPNLLSRMSTPGKAQLSNVELKAGISGAEKAGALSEYKGMMAAVGNASKREANISMFGNELQSQQKVLLDAANDVDRGRVALINKLWANGQTYMGSNPKEAAYAAALQTYVNTYGRLVGGATGQVTDTARKEALGAVSGGYLSPAGLKGATDMLSQKEVNIIRRASDDTVELFTNPERYKRLLSIQDKLRKAGYQVANTTTEDSGNTVTSPPPARTVAPGVAAPRTLNYDPATGKFN